MAPVEPEGDSDGDDVESSPNDALSMQRSIRSALPTNDLAIAGFAGQCALKYLMGFGKASPLLRYDGRHRYELILCVHVPGRRCPCTLETPKW